MDCRGAARLAVTGQGVITPPLVIAMHEAIHRRSHKDMDCRGAVRLAMTGQGVITPPWSSRGTKQSVGGNSKTWIATALRASQ
jgi:hypothetical protein